jgi:hypothetical protein
MRTDSEISKNNLVWKVIFYIILYAAIINYIITKKIEGLIQRIYSWIRFLIISFQIFIYFVVFLVSFQLSHFLLIILTIFSFYYSYCLMYATSCFQTYIFDRTPTHDQNQQIDSNTQTNQEALIVIE